MKGISPLISFVFTVAVLITTITVVWVTGKPVVDKSHEAAFISESSNILNSLDSVIKDVVYGKAGSSRLISLSISGGKYSIRALDSSIEFSLDTQESFIEPFAQLKSGNVYKSGARDVKAYQTTTGGVDSLVLENSHLLVAIRSLATSSSINTSNLTLLIRNKDLNVNITPADTSVFVDETSSTALGTGTTFFVDNGTTFGYAQVVARITSGTPYDVYYTLHSNADFLTVDVRNTTAKNVTYFFGSTLTSGAYNTDSSKYAIYYNSTVATALYSTGASTILTDSTSSTKPRVQQNIDGNEVMYVMTKGPDTTIINGNVDDIRQWSGSFGYGLSKEPKYYSWLYYPIINLTRNETLGKGSYKLYVYNNGTSNGKAQIEIGII